MEAADEFEGGVDALADAQEFVGVLDAAVAVEDVVAELEGQALIGAVAYEEGQGRGSGLEIDEVEGPTVVLDFSAQAVDVEVHAAEVVAVLLAGGDSVHCRCLVCRGSPTGCSSGSTMSSMSSRVRSISHLPSSTHLDLARWMSHTGGGELFVRPPEVVPSSGGGHSPRRPWVAVRGAVGQCRQFHVGAIIGSDVLFLFQVSS